MTYSPKYIVIDPFTITPVLHSYRHLWVKKWRFCRENCDVIIAFNCSKTSFYGKGYYYCSQMTRINAGPKLLWRVYWQNNPDINESLYYAKNCILYESFNVMLKCCSENINECINFPVNWLMMVSVGPLCFILCYSAHCLLIHLLCCIIF